MYNLLPYTPLTSNLGMGGHIICVDNDIKLY